MSDPVLLEFEDGIATVTLNRPDHRNALSQEVSAGIDDALDEVADRGARCVVVTGAGGAFSAGGDIDLMESHLESDDPVDEQVLELQRTTSATLGNVASFPFPTIAKVDGTAFGAGANLAIACDVQLASDDAAIGFGFRNVGLSVDAGTSYLLPRIVGENVAKELVFTGELVDAERARSLGLFNHVYPADEFDERADELVETIATGPTVALRHAKRLVGQGLNKSLAEALDDEAAAQGVVFATRDHEEGVRAFRERRQPEYEGR